MTNKTLLVNVYAHLNRRKAGYVNLLIGKHAGNIIARAFDIERTDAIEQALNLTSEEYIKCISSRVFDSVFSESTAPSADKYF